MDRDDPAALIRVSQDELILCVAIALKVLRPPVQIGRGRKLPHESDRDCRVAAELLARHFEQIGFRIFRTPPLSPHGGGFGRPSTPTEDL